MPVQFRAYIAVMLLSLVALAFFRKTITPDIISTSDFNRRAKLWLLITTAAFLSGNFWVYSVLCMIIAMWASRSEPNRLALFIALVFAVPPLTRLLPGFGPIEYLLQLTPERLLNYSILCPLAVYLFKNRRSRPRGAKAPDVLVAIFILYQIICSSYREPVQSVIRSSFFTITDIGVVYYVASRSLATIREYRETIGAFVVGMGIIALVALFETAKSWWVYETLKIPFGIPEGGYLVRGALSLLRAKASLGHPIVLGLALGVALMLTQSLSPLIASTRRRLLLVGVLFVALLVTFSRGPWVGAFAGMLYMVISGSGRGRRIASAVGASGIVVGILSMTTFGQSIFNMLPFIGSTDSGTVTYRQNLWDTSLVVLKQNLWFGDMYYLRNPLMEVMRQGEGIIDMVNSYLQIGLAYGLTGVGLFLACVLACWNCAKPNRVLFAQEDKEATRIATALRSALVVVLVTIATVSTIEYVSLLIWLILGLCAGFPRLAVIAPIPRKS